MTQTARIPESTLIDLGAWVVNNRPVGGFLEAVLSGDLFEAVARADSQNLEALGLLVKFIYNYVPVGARNVRTWDVHRLPPSSQKIVENRFHQGLDALVAGRL